MRKIQVLGLTLFAVFAVSAAVASAAFAGEWLEDNNPILAGEELPVDTEGTLILVNLTGAGSTAVLVELECSGLFEGTVLAGGVGLIFDLYSLGGETIGSLGDTNTLALACLVIKSAGGLGDCLLNDLVEVWPLNLNLELGAVWETKIELMAAGTEEFLLDFPTYSSYEISCETGFLGLQENKCEGLTTAVLSNVAGGVLGVANQTEETTCTVGKGTLIGEALTSIPGKTLTVS